MSKRTRMFIVFLVLAAVSFMLIPTIQWYFFWDENEREQAEYTTATIKKEAERFAREGFSLFEANFKSSPNEAVDLSKSSSERLDKIRFDAFDVIVDKAKDIYKDSDVDIPSIITYDIAKGAFAVVDDQISEERLNEMAEERIKDYLERYRRDFLFGLKDRSEKIIQLGLDLNGGVTYTLKVDLEDYATVQNKIRKDDAIVRAREKKVDKDGLSEEAAAALDVEELSLDYNKFNLSNKTEVDRVMEIAVEQVTERVNIYGASEPQITQLGNSWIQVDLPGAKDPERLKRLLMGRGSLNFHIVDREQTKDVTAWIGKNSKTKEFLTILDSNKAGEKLNLPVDAGLKSENMVLGVYEKDEYREDKFIEWMVLRKQVGMSGSRVVNANSRAADDTGQIETSFRLNGDGQSEFGDLTKGATAETPITIAVVMDGKVKMSASTDEQLNTASLRVSGGGMTAQESKDFAQLLNLGSKEVKVEIISNDIIGSGLGADYIDKGLQAIFWAMILVVGFMLIWYLGGGLAADIALVFNVIIMAGILSQIQLTLTLAGIAGLILTVGMSVDANVIIFERIKEEVKLGKSSASALRSGFQKAFWTILDANITTFIAAVVLAYFGSGTVQGFAMILAVGIFSSMFTALFVVRLFLDIGVESFKVKRLLISWRR